jgi:hypothetical protein
VSRPAFIDLRVLNEHVELLDAGVGGYRAYLTENNDANWE